MDTTLALISRKQPKGKNGVIEEHFYLHLKQLDIRSFVMGVVRPKVRQKNLKAITFVLSYEPVFQIFC